MNRHLVYTHGYGDRRVADQRQPSRTATPTSSSATSRSAGRHRARATQPERVLRREPARVRARRREAGRVRLPASGQRPTPRPGTTGEDGVELSNIVRRAAFALRFGDINLAHLGAGHRRRRRSCTMRDIARAGRRSSRRSSTSTPTRTRSCSTAGSSGCSTATRRPTGTRTRSRVQRRGRARPRLQLRAQLGEGDGRRLRRHGQVLRDRPRGPDDPGVPEGVPRAVHRRRRDARRTLRSTCGTRRTCSACRPSVFAEYHVTERAPLLPGQRAVAASRPTRASRSCSTSRAHRQAGSRRTSGRSRRHATSTSRRMDPLLPVHHAAGRGRSRAS